MRANQLNRWTQAQAEQISGSDVIAETPGHPFMLTEFSVDVASGKIAALLFEAELDGRGEAVSAIHSFCRNQPKIAKPTESLIDQALECVADGSRCGIAAKRHGFGLYFEWSVQTVDDIGLKDPMYERAIQKALAIRDAIGGDSYIGGIGLKVVGRSVRAISIYVSCKADNPTRLAEHKTEIKTTWARQLDRFGMFLLGSNEIYSAGKCTLKCDSDGMTGMSVNLTVSERRDKNSIVDVISLQSSRQSASKFIDWLEDTDSAFEWMSSRNLRYLTLEEDKDSGALELWVGSRESQQETGSRVSKEDSGYLTLIENGLAWLSREQLECGGFRIQRSATVDGSTIGTPLRDVFSAIAIADVLEPIGRRQSKAIRQNAVAFVIEQRLADGTWRFVSNTESAEIRADVDDTCCAILLLQDFESREILDTAQDLILGTRNRSGLFRTWIGPGADEDDIDSVVNANVIRLFGNDPSVDDAIQFVTECVAGEAKDHGLWYYWQTGFLYLAAARAWRSGCTKLEGATMNIANMINEFGDEVFAGDVIQKSLMCLVCDELAMQWEPTVRRTKDAIAHEQREDGSWARIPAYRGPSPPANRDVDWGSEAITTAIAIRALTV